MANRKQCRHADHSYMAGGNVRGTATLAKYGNFFKNKNTSAIQCTELPYNAAVILWGIYLREMKSFVHIKTGM